MKQASLAYPMYDLANDHFQNTEIITKNGRKVKGQFVEFRVVKGDVEYIYPSEKYCFLPEEKKREFWMAFKKNNGGFESLPPYIMQLGLHEISKILIEPALVS